MSDQRSEIVVTGDVTSGLAALGRLDDATQQNTASVEGLTDAYERAEEQAADLAAQGKKLRASQEDLSRFADENAEAIAQAVAQRRAEAEVLEHEATRLKQIGATQEEIGAATKAALRLRQEAALLVGKEADALRIARKIEIDGLKRASQEREQAASEAKANAKEDIRAAKALAAARKKIASEAEASAKEEIRAAKTLAAARRRTASEEKAAAKSRAQGFRQAEASAARLGATMKKVAAEADKAAASVTRMATARRGFLGVAGALGSIATGLQSVIAMGQQAAAAVLELSQESLEAQQISANLAISIDGARESFKGYVDDLTLAKNANKAFALGVVQDGKEFADVARGVQAISEQQGISSEKLLEQAVVGIGRKSAARLDDLGIILNQEKAERIYAESLGKTADKLSLLQKDEAFQKAALIEISKAGDRAAKSIDGFAVSVVQASVDLENAKTGFLGFEDQMGRTREALRGLSEEQLLDLRFGEVADDASTAGRRLNKVLEEWEVDLMDIRVAADKLGVSYQQLIEGQLEARELEGVERVLKGLDLMREEQIKKIGEEAEEQDHLVNLLQAQGFEQRDIAGHQIRSLELRRDQAELAGDEAEALKLTRAIEVERAKQTAPKKRGGKRKDPNDAINRERDAALQILDARQQIITAENEMVRDQSVRLAQEAHLLELAQEELEVRQEAAELRNPRNAQQRAELETEMLEIRTEARLLDIQVQQKVEEDERRIADERLTNLDREIERLQALGVATQILEQQRRDAAASVVEEFGTVEEAAQFAHEEEIRRIDERRAIAVEDAELELEKFNQEAELAQARGEQVEDLAVNRLDLEAAIAAAEGDTDKRRQLMHKREVARIAERVKKQQRAVAATNSFLGQGATFASTIINAAIKDEKKREKAALRARGVEALARGALETVEAVASFASFNFVQGALHTAAAAVAFTQGGLMLAGRIPGSGGASAGGGAAASGAGTQATATPPSSSQSRDRPSTPASFEELTRIRGGGEVASSSAGDEDAGGNVVRISNSTIVTADTGNLLDDLGNRQAKKQWGT